MFLDGRFIGKMKVSETSGWLSLMIPIGHWGYTYVHQFSWLEWRDPGMKVMDSQTFTLQPYKKTEGLSKTSCFLNYDSLFGCLET